MATIKLLINFQNWSQFLWCFWLGETGNGTEWRWLIGRSKSWWIGSSRSEGICFWGRWSGAECRVLSGGTKSAVLICRWAKCRRAKSWALIGWAKRTWCTALIGILRRWSKWVTRWFAYATETTTLRSTWTERIRALICRWAKGTGSESGRLIGWWTKRRRSKSRALIGSRTEGATSEPWALIRWGCWTKGIWFWAGERRAWLTSTTGSKRRSKSWLWIAKQVTRTRLRGFSRRLQHFWLERFTRHS